MNRRSFLQILGAAGVAIVAAPKAVLARALAQPTVGPPLVPVAPIADGLQTIRITFPDRTVWTMRGYVRSQLVNTPFEGVTESVVEFQPSGPCECIEDLDMFEDRLLAEEAIASPATTIQLDGVSLGEIQDITLPKMSRQMIDVTRDPAFTGLPEEHREYVAGLKRLSPMTFTVNFAEPLL